MRFSPDEHWWWNGHEWRPAVAGDGWSAVNLSPGGRFGPRSIDFQVTKGTSAGTLVWTPGFQDHEIPLS